MIWNRNRMWLQLLEWYFEKWHILLAQLPTAIPINYNVYIPVHRKWQREDSGSLLRFWSLHSSRRSADSRVCIFHFVPDVWCPLPFMISLLTRWQEWHLLNIRSHDDSCEETDAVMVLVTINGNKERIDNFCGNQIPAQLMSNGPSLRIEFKSVRHSASSSGHNQNFRGFKATYKFLTSQFLLYEDYDYCRY